MLSRYAENVYWLGRYVERAENLARLLDTHGSFARDPRATGDWEAVIRINADEEEFFSRNKEATAAAVLYFYLIDPKSPTSILNSIGYARENARTVRHLISTELWAHLNTFFGEMHELKRRDIGLARLAKVASFIKTNCQTHTGIAEGTLYRDQAYRFYQLGRHVERADQTSRLLDVKYRQLQSVEEDPGSPIDISQWNALLRSAAGYQAYRRTRPGSMSTSDVARFLMSDSEFPRSICFCLYRIKYDLACLESEHGLELGEGLRAKLGRVMEISGQTPTDRIEPAWLHKFADAIQDGLLELSGALGERFFGLAEAAE
ncbi:alpha-E domain-containing protein [Thalassobaculum sp.]|jgi:uncharacterized alpha-E superfamily protein|uniref:alpha-E domain-containing protein n=1 Tax=Thalassobaculum sp. TaxID=2022740 RepID=UPI003B5AB447